MTPEKPITGGIIGAGNRGKDVYGKYALLHPEEIKIVAVAEPDSYRLKEISRDHKIPLTNQFKSWEDFFQKPKLCDTVFICTQDQMHIQPALKAIELGYDILLEKPMAVTPTDCSFLVESANKNKRQLRIAHVLRYNNFFQTIYSLIQSGRLGDIITIDHRENVSYYHYAHSFIRGNWSQEKKSSPMILAKSCHDLDILYWLVASQGGYPKKISSFGSLRHFHRGNAPPNAPERCTDGCPVENSCKYYAPRLYISIIPLLHVAQKGGKGMTKVIANLVINHPLLFSHLKNIIPPFKKVENYEGWPVNTITDDFSCKGRWDALCSGPYGKCVYQTSNDVVDHQVTIIEFSNQTTATFTMHGFSYTEGRTIRIDGTKATLLGEALDYGNTIKLFDHLTGKEELILHTKMNIETESGHGGGDYLLMKSFIKSIREKSTTEPLTSAQESLESHMMAFAAEKAREKNLVIDLEDFKSQYIRT